MKLQTVINLEKQRSNLIDYNSHILALGSCFVEHIGEKIAYFKFKNLINPFGILFHPIAIENILYHAIYKKRYLDKDTFFLNEQWHSFDVHSALSDVSKTVFLQRLNKAVQSIEQYISTSTHVIITLGTSWCYFYKETNAPVANCHKISQNKFEKKILSTHQVSKSLENSIALIRKENKTCQIIFTVSPIRLSLIHI